MTAQQIRCPHCSEMFLAPAGSQGKVVSCPHCQGQLRVPDAGAAPPPPPPPRPAASSAGPPPMAMRPAAPPPRPAAPMARSLPGGAASAPPSPAPSSFPVGPSAPAVAPVINDPAKATATGRLMQRRKSNSNLVLYIAIPLTLVFVISVIGVVALIASKDKQSDSSGGQQPANRLVGNWTLDLDDMVKRQGLQGAEAAQAKKMLEGQLKMEFAFHSNGTMSMHAMIPDEGTERASGKYEINNVQGDTMDVHLDVKGQMFGEKLPIKFISSNRFEGNFDGETLVFKKK